MNSIPEYKLARLMELAAKCFKMIWQSFPGMNYDEVIFVAELIRDAATKAKAEGGGLNE